MEDDLAGRLAEAAAASSPSKAEEDINGGSDADDDEENVIGEFDPVEYAMWKSKMLKLAGLEA